MRTGHSRRTLLKGAAAGAAGGAVGVTLSAGPAVAAPAVRGTSPSWVAACRV
ncbi:twin-arginine translocation signal domain-containing protein [Streptomyces chiangmaiensis]